MLEAVHIPAGFTRVALPFLLILLSIFAALFLTNSFLPPSKSLKEWYLRSYFIYDRSIDPDLIRKNVTIKIGVGILAAIIVILSGLGLEK